MSLYEELGLSPDATPEEIKAAHRREVKKAHPDAGGDAKRFARVQLAYSVLSDQRARQEYDETGRERHVDPVDLFRRQAMTTVAGKFSALISAPMVDPRHMDIVVAIRQAIDDDMQMLRVQINDSRAFQDRLRQFQRRLKRKKKEGPDQVALMITAQIEAHDARIDQLEDGLKIAAAAKELIAEYVYEVDKNELRPIAEMIAGPRVYQPSRPPFWNEGS